jgi:hypothetical protein
MRAADIARLSERYPDGPDRGARGPTRALGVETPTWDTLGERIFADFVTEPPYGVGWWAPHPGTSRRIFISDQLDACTTSVETNMIEAAVHWLELIDAIDREDAFQADVIQMLNGQPQMVARPRTTPLESLGPDVVRLHQVGVARALSGALDCAAGTIIGVMALPMNILKADFLGVMRHFERRPAPATEGETYQHEFGQRLIRIISQAGPTGWLDWLLNFRNMLVHRGRRIEIGQFVPRLPFLRDPRGRPIIRANVITQLPQEPDRSDVDVHLEPNIAPVLTEDVRQTLGGAMGSVRTLIEALAEQLGAAWDWRKANPDALHQPRTQWPRVGREARADRPQPFGGYAPGTHAYEPSQLMIHPGTAQKLAAASLFDHQRHQWQAFD